MVLKGNVVAVDIKVGSGKEAKVNCRVSFFWHLKKLCQPFQFLFMYIFNCIM